MRHQSIDELTRIIYKLTSERLNENRAMEIIDKFSFKKQSGRKCGEENKNSFMRKGIVGDWKNNFSDQAVEVFKQYAGNELIKLGYEKDLQW